MKKRKGSESERTCEPCGRKFKSVGGRKVHQTRTECGVHLMEEAGGPGEICAIASDVQVVCSDNYVPSEPVLVDEMKEMRNVIKVAIHQLLEALS